MKKQKYTIYLSNTSKIVLTGNYTEKQTIVNKILKLLKSKQFSLFDTDTDMVFVNPLKIVSIHVSNIEDNKTKDIKDNIDDEIDSNDLNDIVAISEIDREIVDEDFSDDTFDESNIDSAINDAFDKMDLSELNEITNGEALFQEAEAILSPISTEPINDDDDDEEEVLLDCSKGV